MEVPDILDWVKPDELLLTTAYPLREDPAALEVNLGAEDLRRLDEILPPGAAAGERYHARGMETVNR